jgi:hypothetical protein
LNGPDVAVEWVIDAPKILSFLLNPDHEDGASKEKFLVGFGFSRHAPSVLADALVEHAIANFPGVRRIPPKGPPRIVFEGTVTAPDGREMPLRTVWEIYPPATMRFITAVPLTR